MMRKPMRGTLLNRTHPLSKGLVGCWLFNEATGETVFDLSGNSNNGTLENGVAWGSNGRLKFDGVNDYVDCGHFDIDGNGTIVARINPTTVSGNRAILFKADNLGNNTTVDFSVYVDDGYLKCQLADNSNNQSQVSTLAISTGIPQFVAVTVNGDYINFYVDDKVESIGQTVTPAGNQSKYSIGRLGEYDLFDFHGSIYFVYAYDRTLSAEEITWVNREPYAMFEPSFNPALLYSAVPPVGAIMNQFQRANLGADLYNGVFA